MSLQDYLSKLRKVKYGDMVLSSDHNDLVDAVLKLAELVGVAEGNYSFYNLIGDYPLPHHYETWSTPAGFTPDEKYFYYVADYGYGEYRPIIVKVEDGSIYDTNLSVTPSDYSEFSKSIFGKYRVCVKYSYPRDMYIFKDNTLIQTITGDYWYVIMSNSGQYIASCFYEEATDSHKIRIFKGA